MHAAWCNLQDVRIVSSIVIIDHVAEYRFSVSPLPSIPDGLTPLETVNLGLGPVEDLGQIHSLQGLVGRRCVDEHIKRAEEYFLKLPADVLPAHRTLRQRGCRLIVDMPIRLYGEFPLVLWQGCSPYVQVCRGDVRVVA